VERPTKISEHLNIVEVKCQGVDKRVLKVLKFLCTFNIRKLTCNFSVLLSICSLEKSGMLEAKISLRYNGVMCVI
jgi:hypothetical protein